jgi:hypothetical protein
LKVVPSLAALPFDFKSWIWLGSLGRARSVLQIFNSKTHWFQIWHLLPLDSISGFAWVAWNVPAQYSRWLIPRHIGPDLAPLPFGCHFWICLGSLERARSVLQMINSKTHWFQICHLLPLDSISGSAWVAWNVPAQYSRWQIPRHIGPDLAPLPFGCHFWICLGSLERARSVLQMFNSKTHWCRSGTALFWTSFLDLLG